MIGESTIICLDTGEWNYPPPECYSEFNLQFRLLHVHISM